MVDEGCCDWLGGQLGAGASFIVIIILVEAGGFSASKLRKDLEEPCSSKSPNVWRLVQVFYPRSGCESVNLARLQATFEAPYTKYLTQSPRLLSKLSVSPQDTQPSVCMVCVGPRITHRSRPCASFVEREDNYMALWPVLGGSARSTSDALVWYRGLEFYAAMEGTFALPKAWRFEAEQMALLTSTRHTEARLIFSSFEV